MQPFALLETAMILPPCSPEATIANARGQCLAMCDASGDRAVWAVTQLGATRSQERAA